MQSKRYIFSIYIYMYRSMGGGRREDCGKMIFEEKCKNGFIVSGKIGYSSSLRI